MSYDATPSKRSETADLARIPYGSPVEQVVELLSRDGGLVLTDALTAEQVAQINADIDPILASAHLGSISEDERTKAFHGARTKRVTNVISVSRTYRDAFLANPATLAYAHAAFEGVSEALWLNSNQVIEIHPGESAQMLHRDMGNYPIFYRYGPSGPEVIVNMIVALVDITADAGATRVIPGSHAWEFDKPFTDEMTIPAEMRAGSVFFFNGKLVHGGGANITKDVRRRAIGTAFNPGFLVPEEAHAFAVPMSIVREMSPALQQIIGFRSFHQRNPEGGSLWQHNYEELANFLDL